MAYKSCLIFALICFASCTGIGNKDDHAVNDSTGQEPAVDLRPKGIEDLGQSTNLEDILCQSWDYKEDAIDAEDADPNAGVQIQYRGYSFFKDGKLVKDPRGLVRTGTWTLVYDPKPITLVMKFDDDGERQTEIPASFTPTKLKFAGRIGVKDITVLTANGYRHINMKNDPFHPDNIWWMIQPGSSETDEQIKKRLKACLHFFVLFYEEYVNVRAKKVSFVGLPSPFKWYAGGIILQKESKLTPKWLHCFYNDEQAIKAFKLADKLFDKKYDWPKDEGQWMKRNLGVLKQMENRLDSIN